MTATIFSTTIVQSWTGADLSAIGPIYPFVGGELILWLLGLVFWLWFHFTQFQIEARELREDDVGARNPEWLNRVFAEQAKG